MWISIIGTNGSGKSLVKNFLDKRGFRLESELFNINSSLDVRSDFYFNHDMSAYKKRLNQDIFTIGSFWDYHECVVPYLFETFQITERDLNLMNERYNTTKDFLEPPSCIIYTKMSEQQSYNRLILSGEDINHSMVKNLQRQIEMYESFIQRVAVPVVDIDMGQDIGRVFQELEYSVDSVLTTRLDVASIWQRSMFL